jgi:hypothetical protein
MNISADPLANFFRVMQNSRVYQNNIIAANYTAVSMVSCMQFCVWVRCMHWSNIYTLLQYGRRVSLVRVQRVYNGCAW